MAMQQLRAAAATMASGALNIVRISVYAYTHVLKASADAHICASAGTALAGLWFPNTGSGHHREPCGGLATVHN